jgi:hypothetical protein
VLDLFPRLKERLSHGGQQLSGGEQQMLSIGRALMTNPDCLILDEATEGLAPKIVHEIWNVIATIRPPASRRSLSTETTGPCWPMPTGGGAGKGAGRHVRARRRSGRRARRAGPLPRRLISRRPARRWCGLSATLVWWGNPPRRVTRA